MVFFFVLCAGSVKCSPISKKEEEEIELVRTLVSAKRRAARNIVMPTLLLESGLLQGSKFVLLLLCGCVSVHPVWELKSVMFCGL